MKWMDGINAEAMDKWMVDLRSGKFKQGVGLLRNGFDEMCCLGVATDTNVKACSLTREFSEELGRYVYIDREDHVMGALMPSVVMDYLGIPAKYRDTGYDGGIYVIADMESEEEETKVQEIGGKHYVNVISLNDTLGKTFPEIADRIEATFKVEEE